MQFAWHHPVEQFYQSSYQHTAPNYMSPSATGLFRRVELSGHPCLAYDHRGVAKTLFLATWRQEILALYLDATGKHFHEPNV
jgi:hypothetical protein